MTTTSTPTQAQRLLAPDSWLPNPAPVLVCVFLRGGADALNIVVPHGEAAYYHLRPSLAIARPDDARTPSRQRTIDLDGFFGLHPALAPLLPIWQAGQLAAVHAFGSPDDSRSHFQAQDVMERGAADTGGSPAGWLGRHLASSPRDNRSPLRAVALGEMVPRALRGPRPAVALRDLADFRLAQELRAPLPLLYDGADRLAQVARDTLATLDRIEQLSASPYRPADGARYPDDRFGFGRRLRQVARLVKADVGLEAACLDLTGWDTHFAQGGAEGALANMLTILGQGLAAFHTDLGGQSERVSTLALSEFGRRAEENGTGGTDHGHGGAALLLGGAVAGKRVHGDWPGLAPDKLAGPGDLAITTDYRDVLAELVLWLGNVDLGAVFPGYAARQRGLIKNAAPSIR